MKQGGPSIWWIHSLPVSESTHTGPLALWWRQGTTTISPTSNTVSRHSATCGGPPPKLPSKAASTSPATPPAPQASPAQAAFTEAYLIGDALDCNSTNDQVFPEGECSNPLSKSQPDPSESEDCLFHDVMVPRIIFQQHGNAASKAPVLVYIFSGGLNFGSKMNFGPFGGSSEVLSDH